MSLSIAGSNLHNEPLVMSDKENDGGLLLTPGFEVGDPDLDGDIRIFSGVFANSGVTNPSPRPETRKWSRCRFMVSAIVSHFLKYFVQITTN